MKKLFFSTLICTLLVAASCKKCKDCTMKYQDNFSGSLVEQSIGEVCGDSLSKIDGKTFTTNVLGIQSQVSYTCK
jgi:nitrous oxide reductase accessory protein NosL